jgi:uncharacterized protein (TIGR02145 family)
MSTENETTKYCPFCKNKLHKSLDDIRSDINKFLSPYFDLYGHDIITDILDDEIISRKPTTPKVDIKQGYFEDPRDGEIYETLYINGTEWLAENMRFHCKESSVLDDEEKNSETIGRLYTYEAAKKYLPKGWRLPTIEDWDSLINFAKEITGNATESLMHKTSWYLTNDVIPMDNFGFGIYAAGYVDIFGEHVHTADTECSELAAFWADNADVYNSEGNPAENCYFLSRGGWSTYYRAPDYKFSVRLVRDL